ncbi:MAG: M20/M25/M40 family metallo-hydrolase [Puniceicoccales bacterium]|jgi:acetylornithine deacetylase/succinyl-diaminopimelate desuccinylase-like protein|nr:M20/M25/M40 family metallo-hydrolase [Puniceicoccales bacterium]
MDFQEIEPVVQFLRRYASYPSISSDPSCERGMRDTRDCISEFLRREHFEVQILATAKHPILLASRPISSSAPSLLLYGHYDVQPPEPLELWESPPFVPTLRHDVLYGRGIADNKGAHAILLHALVQVLRENPHFPWNIRLLLEGEEEIGSPHMEEFLKTHGDTLRSELFLLSDTGTCDEQHLSLTTGLRGLLSLEFEVTTASTDLHSGLGGPMPNAAQVLSEICARLHDADGRVTVEDFYREVQRPSAEELVSLENSPLSEETLRSEAGLSAFAPHEGSAAYAQKFLPTLEINGLSAGWQGPGVKTIIPSSARAKISCRLVPDQSPEKILQSLQERLRTLCPPWARLTILPEALGKPYRFPLESLSSQSPSPSLLAQAFRLLQEATQQVMSTPLRLSREGGSIPLMQTIQELTGMNPLMLGFFTSQNRLHAPNENLSLAMMTRVYHVFRHFFAGLAQIG